MKIEKKAILYSGWCVDSAIAYVKSMALDSERVKIVKDYEDRVSVVAKIDFIIDTP